MSELPYERKLAAIVYADVAGYSRLTSRDEAGTHEQLCACLDLIAERTRNTGGRVVHYAGDAVLAEFESVVAATHCAIGIQRAIATRSVAYAEDRRLLFRIGINMGDVIVDRDDIYGEGVNVAARLEELALPGGICMSAAVHDQVRGKVDAPFEDLGNQELKNIEHPVRAFRIGVDPSPAEGEDASVQTISRFSACADVLAASAEPESAPAFVSRPPPSIMILPFKNLSGMAEHDLLVDGFRLSIQSVLVKLSSLFLVHAGVMEVFRGREISAVQAGHEAGIRYVLEAAVQLAGNKVRVTAQLTDAPAGQVAWSERYDRALDDVLELQDEITTEVVTALEGHVTDGRGELVWWHNLPGWRSREKALRAISHLYRGTRQDNKLARLEFKELDRISPGQGQGLALVALTHFLDAFRGWEDPESRSMEHASELAERAVELGDPDGMGCLVLGFARLYERRHEEAMSLLQHAALLRASCPLAHGMYANALLYSGQPDEAIREMKHAIRAQRVYPPWMVNVLAASYRDAGEIVPSLSVARESLRLDRENVDTHAILCTDHSLSRSLEEARECAREILRIEPDFSIEGYTSTKPYRESKSLDAIIDALREAGLG